MTFDEDRLMRYFDGELDAEEAREMERTLANSPEARALLGDFERVGAEVRAIAEEQGARASGIVDHVMANLELPGASSPVIGAPSPVMGASSPAKSARGASGRVIPFAPVVGFALAAAAAVALLIRTHVPEPAVVGPVPAETESVAAVPAASESAAPTQVAAAGAEDAEPGASIESVDFGAQNGTIFMVASGPQVTPVVWLVDEGSPSGGRMAPL